MSCKGGSLTITVAGHTQAWAPAFLNALHSTTRSASQTAIGSQMVIESPRRRLWADYTTSIVSNRVPREQRRSPILAEYRGILILMRPA